MHGNARHAFPATVLPSGRHSLLSIFLQCSDPLLVGPSYMLRCANDLSPHLTPIDARVQLLVHESAHRDIVTADEVEAVLHLARRLRIVGRSDDALPGLREDEVGHLVA